MGIVLMFIISIEVLHNTNSHDATFYVSIVKHQQKEEKRMKRKIVAVMLSTAMVFGLQRAVAEMIRKPPQTQAVRTSRKPQTKQMMRTKLMTRAVTPRTRQRNHQQKVTVKRLPCSVLMMPRRYGSGDRGF